MVVGGLETTTVLFLRWGLYMHIVNVEGRGLCWSMTRSVRGDGRSARY